MPDIRRCVIYGCKSNSRDNKSLKFFNFPARDNPLYEIWLSICDESAESIRWQRRPYICSKHFHEKDVGFRRLATGAVPALFLKAPPGFAEEEKKRQAELEAERAEKRRLINLVNDTVLEWVRRARNYPETGGICTTRRELRRVAMRARNLLGATLSLTVDDYWLRKFRASHMIHVDKRASAYKNKTLDLEAIIGELAPNASIKTDEEISDLLKQEEAKILEIEEKRRRAKKKKKRAEEVNMAYQYRKKYGVKMTKKVFENALSDYYGKLNKTKTEKDEPEEDDTEILDSSIHLPPKSEILSDSMEISHDETADFDDTIDDYVPSSKSELVIETYKQALEHLKPLEDFALRQENYRVIGLLSTLEIIFKSPQENQ